MGPVPDSNPVHIGYLVHLGENPAAMPCGSAVREDAYTIHKPSGTGIEASSIILLNQLGVVEQENRRYWQALWNAIRNWKLLREV